MALFKSTDTYPSAITSILKEDSEQIIQPAAEKWQKSSCAI